MLQNQKLIQQNTGVRFTFSGKERDSEPSAASSRTPLKINRNSEQTNLSYFGARYYTSDLGVWLSVDPLSDKYPSLSPYAYVANNPILFVDPDGREIEISGETRQERKQVRKDIRQAKKHSDEFKQDFKKLKKSKETYVFSKTEENDIGGHTTTDGEKIFIYYSHSSEGNAMGDGKLTSLFHEIKHGVQFEEGRIGFVKTTRGWAPINRDLSDELEGFQAGTRAPGTVHSRNGQKTFNGDASNIFSRSQNDLQNVRKNFINFWYGNQPEASYHRLPLTPLTIRIMRKLKTASILCFLIIKIALMLLFSSCSGIVQNPRIEQERLPREFTNKGTAYYGVNIFLKLNSNNTFVWTEDRIGARYHSKGVWEEKKNGLIVLKDENQSDFSLIKSHEEPFGDDICIQISDENGKKLSYGVAELTSEHVIRLDSIGFGCVAAETPERIKIFRDVLFYEYIVKNQESRSFDLVFSDLSILNRAFKQKELRIVDKNTISVDSDLLLKKSN